MKTKFRRPGAMSKADRNECVDRITRSLYKIGDADRLSNVRDWVVKLTTGEPCPRKTDYLRVLAYALDGGGGGGGVVREPFASPPPDGPLADVNRLARAARPLPAGDDDGGSSSDELAGMPDDTAADGDAVSVQQFVADAGRYTRDGGRLMAQAADRLLDDFRRTAAAAFDDRARKLGDALAKEQAALLHRYRANGRRVLARAHILLDHVRELLPTFRYDRYVDDPDGHVALVMAERSAAASRCAGLATVPPPTGGVPSDDELDVLEDGGGGGGAMQKKMMCALNWLRSEVARVDCEHAALVRRYEAVVAAVAEAGERKAAEECRANEQKRSARADLARLRQQSAQQVALIDTYVERIGSDRRHQSSC